LGGGLHEVADDRGSMEAGVLGFGDEVVDTVAEFVEEGGLYTIKPNQISTSPTHTFIF